MKRIFFYVSILAIIFFVCTNTISAQVNNSALLRHTVIITFKQDAPADSIKALDDLYAELSKNSLVKSFEWGINISPRDSGTIKHIYVTTFASQDDMKAYKKILAYAKLFPISLAVSDDVGVVDYWINN